MIPGLIAAAVFIVIMCGLIPLTHRLLVQEKEAARERARGNQ